MMVKSERRSIFGMSCVQCDNELIAPEWSEYRSKQQNRHHWRLLEMRLLFRNHCQYEGDGRSYDRGRNVAVAVSRAEVQRGSAQSCSARHFLKLF